MKAVDLTKWNIETSVACLDRTVFDWRSEAREFESDFIYQTEFCYSDSLIFKKKKRKILSGTAELMQKMK